MRVCACEGIYLEPSFTVICTISINTLTTILRNCVSRLSPCVTGDRVHNGYNSNTLRQSAIIGRERQDVDSNIVIKAQISPERHDWCCTRLHM